MTNPELNTICSSNGVFLLHMQIYKLQVDRHHYNYRQHGNLVIFRQPKRCQGKRFYSWFWICLRVRKCFLVPSRTRSSGECADSYSSCSSWRRRHSSNPKRRAHPRWPGIRKALESWLHLWFRRASLGRAFWLVSPLWEGRACCCSVRPCAGHRLSTCLWERRKCTATRCPECFCQSPRGSSPFLPRAIPNCSSQSSTGCCLQSPIRPPKFRGRALRG